MKNELKKWVSVKLLIWSFNVMPDCEFKKELAKLINSKILTGID